MQSTRGRLLLFADADGATKFSDYDKVEKSLFDLLKTGKLAHRFGLISKFYLYID